VPLTTSSVRLCGLAALLALISGCAGRERPDTSAPRLSAEDQQFLVPPSTGYPLTLRPGEADRLDAAYQGLIYEGERAPAIDLSRQALGRDPDAHPAIVLAAQVAFLDGDTARAVELLTPSPVELSRFTSWQLLLGRSFEKQSDLVSAFEAYGNVASSNAAAQAKTQELGPRVAMILARRIEDHLQKGRIEDASRDVARMEEWLPDQTPTLEAASAVARALGNPEGELKAIAQLSARDPANRTLAERRAILELEVGDAGAGLRIFQDLAAQYPEDAALQEQLARARFLWRLQLLPIETRDLVSRRELSRGDLAAMVYWLFPDVRYGQARQVRIANDVLDETYRDEIVRVVNLGIMDVDDRLHEFSPTRPVSRSESLTSMVRLLARRQPPVACIGDTRSGVSLDPETVCTVAASCGLIASEADCRPAATVSGSEGLELSRLTLNLLGVSE
jgi:hypothetical protein